MTPGQQCNKVSDGAGRGHRSLMIAYFFFLFFFFIMDFAPSKIVKEDSKSNETHWINHQGLLSRICLIDVVSFTMLLHCNVYVTQTPKFV